MVPPLPRDPRAPAGLILVGPGARARELGLALAGLAEERAVETRAFDDVAELGLEAGRAALLLLDVDATPLEDAGYVRRFLAAHAQVEVVAFGGDPRARTVRVLGVRRFAPWPPDLDDLAGFVAAASGAHGAQRRTRVGSSAPTRPDRPTPTSAPVADHAELDEVRAILDGDDSPADRGPTRASDVDAAPPRNASERRTGADFPDEFAPAAPRSRASDLDAPFSDLADLDSLPSANAHRSDAHPRDDHARGAELGSDVDDQLGARLATHLGLSRAAIHEDQPDLGADPDVSAPRPAIDAPPWWRAQVADLADAAQRIDLSLKMLAAAAPDIDEGQAADAQARLRELEAEVARLLQFTRTLGYVAAPPPAGAQTFELGEIVHLFAANLAQSGPDAPRCQFKTARASVRSDRQLVSQTLDALFFLVRCTSRKGDLVRAQVQTTDDARGAGVELSIDFPSGPLEGFGADDVITPYALADLFPELGPNALAAAAGIVAGQGGSLALVNRARSRMTWTLWMPRAG